jgi:hypothetical protein
MGYKRHVGDYHLIYRIHMSGKRYFWTALVYNASNGQERILDCGYSVNTDAAYRAASKVLDIAADALCFATGLPLSIVCF